MKTFFTFLAALVAVHGTDGKLLSIEKIEVDIDSQFVKVKSALEAVDGINTINLDLTVLKEETDIEYQAVVYRFNVDHYEHFYKSDMETGCSHETVKDPILTFIFKETTKYGNITAACPLKVGHYALKNFKIDSSDLPHQLPAGSYRFDFTAYIKKSGQMHDIYTDKYYFSSE